MHNLSSSTPSRMIRALTAALLLGLLTALITFLWREHQSIDHNSQRQATRQADLLGAYTLQIFQQVDQLLQSGQQLLQQQLASGPLQAAAYQPALHALAQALQQVDALRYTDAQGQLQYPEQMSAATGDRDLIGLESWPENPGLAISTPRQDAGTGEWYMVLSRAVSRPDGSQAGALSARIYSSYFDQLHATFKLGPEDSITVFHLNGTGFARYPFGDRVIGRSFAQGKLFRDILPEHPKGVSRPSDRTDGVLRLVAHCRLDGFPLLVTLGITDTAAFQNWYRQLYLLSALYLIFSIFVIWLCRALFKKTVALDRSHLALQREQAFERAVFDSSSSITLILHPDGTIFRANSAAEAITGCSRRELENRPFWSIFDGHYSDYVRQWLASGPLLEAQQLKELEASCGADRSVTLSLWVTPLFDKQGQEQYRIVSGIDISERKQAEAKIWHQANYDGLTDLPNRSLLLDRGRQAIKRHRRQKKPIALMFIDLDRFKQVNDHHGHIIGDQVLVEVARRLKLCIRQQDTAARYAGDEFIVLMPELQGRDEVEQICQRLLHQLHQPMQLDGINITLSASIGIALYPLDSDSLDKLITRADDAMYQAKMSGRNRYQCANGLTATGS